MIVSWNNRYTAQVVTLWNREAVKDSYKELTEADFQDTFLNNPYFNKDTAFVWMEQEEVKGFACGCMGDDLPLGAEAGYITCIILDNDSRTSGNYKLLLDALEKSFTDAGKKQADILFFNPMKLIWTIPGTDGHEHNNAPGLPIDSQLYSFLLEQGYVERAKQCGMYLNLAEFSIPDDIKAKEAKAASKGYSVELYDPSKHSGIDEMAKSFDNPMWEKEIPHHAAKGDPVVIAAFEGKTVGFAGPIIRQHNGRAFFCGIGVNAEHEGHGLGSILFFKMCEAFQTIHTDYISLFTGSTNPAIRIYEKAGFRTVKQFGVLRREF